MERSYQYQSLRDARLTFGTSDSPGRETLESIHFVNVMARPMSAPYGSPTGEAIEVSLALTVPQMAQIVVHFFWHLRQGVYGKFLRRLLAKRWGTMTASRLKRPALDEKDYCTMQYHRGV